MKKAYDYLIVGTGLYGSVFAHEANLRGKRCLAIEKRAHIGGNVFTESIEGIQVHRYGPHIFHTDHADIWNYVNQFAHFNRFTNCPLANYKGELFHLPFNMNTFYELWGVTTPDEARKIIDEQRAAAHIEKPRNLEEQALSTVGKDIYEKLIKGYTEKQWGRPCSELPAFILRRLPIRLTYDNNYFNSRFQGIPEEGYTRMVQNILGDIEVVLNTDYLQNREYWSGLADHVVYTGPIDAYFDHCFGPLEYRSLRFETDVLDTDNYQGNAVINHTDAETPFTRVIEHKHFSFGTQEKTVVTREYSEEWSPGKEAFYPINDDKNNALYKKYLELARKEKNVSFGGRLGEYKYYDMDAVIAAALQSSRRMIE